MVAGAGKTKLTSTVIDDLCNFLGEKIDNEALAYFYCDRNHETHRIPDFIVRSYVRQLSTTPTGDRIHPVLLDYYKEQKKLGFAAWPPTIQVCTKLLSQLIESYPQTTIILDALDECDNSTRHQLIQIFDDLAIQSAKPVKIFISSRPDNDINYRFRTGPNIAIRATDNRDDIAMYVEERISTCRKDWLDGVDRIPNLQNEIRSVLVEKSQGMLVSPSVN